MKLWLKNCCYSATQMELPQSPSTMYKLFDERSYLCRCLIKGCDVDDCISISIVITVVCKLPKTYLYLIYKCIIQFKYFSNKVTKVQTQILGINHRYFGFCPIISTFRQIFSNGANFWSLSYLITTISTVCSSQMTSLGSFLLLVIVVTGELFHVSWFCSLAMNAKGN